MTYKTLFVSVLILRFGINCFGQSYSEKKRDSAINQTIGKLNSNGIDTICVYRNYCVGCLLVLHTGKDTSCRRQPYANETYFFWKHNGITKFTKRNYCF